MAHHRYHSGQQQSSNWAERTARDSTPPRGDDDERPICHQAFKHAHTSLGVAGHLVHMAGVFVPVIAGELIESPAKYKKVVRLASIGTAMAYEGIHVYNEMKRREKQEAKLAECHSKLEQCER